MSAPVASTSEVSITFGALLRYHESEVARWRAWFDRQPSAVLDLAFGDAARNMGTVRAMLWHIGIVEWVYARAIGGQPYDDWGKFPRETLDELFAIGRQAQSELRAYLAVATDAEMIEPVSISGEGATITGTRRKFLTHFFVHSLRHWAQLSTVLRQHGYQTDWQHDLVMSDAVE